MKSVDSGGAALYMRAVARESTIAELEQLLETRRRTLDPMSTIAVSRYVADVETLLQALKEERHAVASRTHALRSLARKCVVTAESSRARARSEADAELRGRLLGQAASLEYVAERITLVVGT